MATPMSPSETKTSRRPWWIVLLVVGLLVVCLACVCVLAGIVALGAISLPAIALDGQPTGKVSAGNPAPDFTLSDLNGQSVTLSQLRGSVVVVDFWATWCGPCKEELPHLQALYARYKSRGLIVLALDVGESANTARSYVSSKNYTFTVLLDSKSTVVQQYGVRGIPATFIVDTQGIVRKTTMGYSASMEKELEQAIVPLLPR